MDEKLSSLQCRDTESIERALATNDDVAAARLGSPYNAKTRRIQALHNADLTPLRRGVLGTLAAMA